MTTTLTERPTTKPVILYSVTAETIEQMAAKFAGLKINGIEDKAGYQLVHSARMECVKARGNIEKTRKELKAESLEFGRKVDAEAKLLTVKIEKIEARLETEQQVIEDAKEKLRLEREDAMVAERAAALAPYPQSNRSDVILRGMTATQFAEYLADAIKADEDRKAREAEQARIAEANRIEAERLAAERAELQRIAAEQEAERKRVQAIEDEARAKERAELDRQRKEQAEAQAKIDAENARIAKAELDAANAKVIAQAKAEAAERARVETEQLLARQAAEKEALRVAEEAAAKRAEALKPIRDKLLKFADDVLRLETPDTTPEIDAAVLAVLNGAAEAIRKIARGAK
jgi:hypothetical protein